MGNLLNRKETFAWPNPSVNYGKLLENYVEALKEARFLNDIVYCPSEVFSQDPSLNYIFNFLWTNGNSYEKFKSRYDWIEVDQFQILINIYSLLGQETPQKSDSWISFNSEFHLEHNSMLGISDALFTPPLVFDKNTLYDFHKKNVSNFSFQERGQKKEYFLRFHRPQLKVDPSRIRQMIDRGQVPGIVKRLDNPSTDPSGNILHHEQFHIHFESDQHDVALNLDGTWKHNRTNFIIPQEMCEMLCEWGFGLPEKYYD